MHLLNFNIIEVIHILWLLQGMGCAQKGGFVLWAHLKWLNGLKSKSNRKQTHIKTKSRKVFDGRRVDGMSLETPLSRQN